jgi:hypothetical protein
VYSPPWFLFNPHVETIYPSLFRKVELKEYIRERISTSDHDFLDLDWLKQEEEKKIVIISHGLEGNTQRAYIKGMAKVFYDQGFDVLTWNYRGCSEEMNKNLRFYHSGATDDLATVVDHVISKGYDKVFLIGFSLGGNLTLKYAGERDLDKRVKGIAAFSVPMNLHTSCIQLSKRENWIYSQRFVKSLKKKVQAKAKLMKDLNIEGLDEINNLLDFDNRYTAPLHGYKDALDYYQQCGAIRFIESIKVPTLIVNAKNDPFLSAECFPQMTNHPYVKLEFPERGGHVGFASFNRNGLYWSEQRALNFIQGLNS